MLRAPAPATLSRLSGWLASRGQARLCLAHGSSTSLALEPSGSNAPASAPQLSPDVVDEGVTGVSPRQGCAAGDLRAPHEWRLMQHVMCQQRGFSSLAASAALDDTSSSSDEEGGPSGRLSPEEYRQKHDMRVDDPDAPAPFQTFEEAPLPRELVQQFTRSGFTGPSSIQAQAWPIAMAGRDLVAIANTGSGKTCGFLIPIFTRMQQEKRRHNRYAGPTAVVLAPTRELAQQIGAEAAKFGAPFRARIATVFGGAGRGKQSGELARMPDLVIATPGRLCDFLESWEVSIKQTPMLVLDEADRMLDMGFEPQIQKVVNYIRTERQTLFFSATWPQNVRRIARQFCRNDPVHVFIGEAQDKLVANRDITQRFQVLPDASERLPALLRYLEQLPPGSRTIVFCDTKRVCDSITLHLNESGIVRCAAVHGDKEQRERERVLHSFRQGRLGALVATDVAARGLDIKGVTHVVNFEFPRDDEMYVHRIGRTGRAGAKGESFTLVTKDDEMHAQKIMEVLQGAGQEVPAEIAALARHAPRAGRGGHDGRPRSRQQRPWEGRSRSGGRYSSSSSSFGGNFGRSWGGGGGRSGSRGGGWGDEWGGVAHGSDSPRRHQQRGSSGGDSWQDSWQGGKRGSSAAGDGDQWTRQRRARY